MEPLQARALDALQPFVALSKSATSARAAADLVIRATSCANTYVFAELLETPNIQSLRTAEAQYAAHLTLLEIFAWGTWQDYKDTPNLPELNAQQLHKLRLLSLLTLCKNVSNLRYQPLQAALGLSSARRLEDLVIGATNTGLITAKLSPSMSIIFVSSVSSLRDLSHGSVTRMVEDVSAWDARCNRVLADIDQHIQEARRRAAERRKAEEAMQKAVERVAQGGEKAGGKRAAADHALAGLGGAGPLGENGNAGGGSPGDDCMDIDDAVAGIGGGAGDMAFRERAHDLGGFSSLPSGAPRKNARVSKTGGLFRR